MFILIFSIIILIVLFEIIILILFKSLKKDFQWLIDASDERPKFNEDLVKKYNNKIFNKDLGWDNQINKKNTEIIIKNKKFHFEYNFDTKGSRITGNKFKNEKISVFGDSYAFSRCSQDNQTIQYYLEKKFKFKISNHGVGNYGLDQVFLKIKKKINKIGKTKNIIIIFVPETISRIHSYWKHFLEFGNILGFKPKLIIKNNKIVIFNSHITKLNISKIDKKIDLLKKKDVFFEKKFLKNKFSFSYLLSFLKNSKKNSSIFYFLILKKFFKDNKFKEQAFSIIVKNNLIESQKLYLNNKYNILLEKIILETDAYLKKRKKKAFFFIIPQLFDLKLNIKLMNSPEFFKSLSKNKNLNIFDLSKEMKKLNNIERYYFDDYYGGHLNFKGNKIVSELIYKKIKNLLW